MKYILLLLAKIKGFFPMTKRQISQSQRDSLDRAVNRLRTASWVGFKNDRNKPDWDKTQVPRQLPYEYPNLIQKSVPSFGLDPTRDEYLDKVFGKAEDNPFSTAYIVTLESGSKGMIVSPVEVKEGSWVVLQTGELGFVAKVNDTCIEATLSMNNASLPGKEDEAN